MHKFIPEGTKINKDRSKELHAHLRVETHLNFCKMWAKDGMLMHVNILTLAAGCTAATC